MTLIWGGGQKRLVREKIFRSFEKLFPNNVDLFNIWRYSAQQGKTDEKSIFLQIKLKANCPTTEKDNQVQCADGSLEFISAGTFHSEPGQCDQSGGIIRCPPNVNRLCVFDGRLVCNAKGCIEESKTCPTTKQEKASKSLEVKKRTEKLRLTCF